MFRNHGPLIMLPLLLWGCSGGEDTETDTDTGVVVDPATGIFVATDNDGNGLQGMVMTSGDESATTDGDGVATLSLAGDADFEVKGTLTGYPDAYYFGHARAGGEVKLSRYWFSTAEIESIAQQHGETYDSSKGIVAINVTEQTGEFFAPVFGTQVSIGLPYDFAMVADPQAASGFRDGDAVWWNSLVYFVNVDPGDVTLGLILPSGYDCVVVDGDDAATEASIRSIAGSQSTMTARCSQ